MVVLHEREIRQSKRPFDILLNADTPAAFKRRIDELFDERFGVVATAIKKTEFRDELEEEFDRIMQRTKMRGMPETFRFCIAHEQANSTGLQLAEPPRQVSLEVLLPRSGNSWRGRLKRPRS